MSEGMHYTYRVEWSPEDEEYVGLVAEFPSLSHLDPDPVEAIRGIRELVDAVVADMRESGEVAPVPLGERRYSGKVFVRTSPELHRRLTIEAAEQGVSVNQWAAQKLAERSGGVQDYCAAYLRGAVDAAKRVARENLDGRSLAALIVASVCDVEQHAVDSTLHPVFRWNPGTWRVCRECGAKRAAGAEEDAVEEARQLP